MITSICLFFLTLSIYSFEDVSFLGTSIFVTEFEYELPPNEKSLYLNQDNQFLVKGDKAVVILRPVKKGNGKIFKETFEKGYFPFYKISTKKWFWWDSFEGIWKDTLIRSGSGSTVLSILNKSSSIKKLDNGNIEYEFYLYINKNVKKFSIFKKGNKDFSLSSVGSEYFQITSGKKTSFPRILLKKNINRDVFLVYPVVNSVLSGVIPTSFAPYIILNKDKYIKLSTKKVVSNSSLEYEKKIEKELSTDYRIYDGPKNRWFTQQLKLVKGAFDIRNYHSLFSVMP